MFKVVKQVICQPFYHFSVNKSMSDKQSTVQKIEFDEFAEDYDKLHAKNIASSGFAPSYFDEYKIKEVARILHKVSSSSSVSILNYGCGIGKSEMFFHKYFPSCSSLGVDISPESIRKAEEENIHLPSAQFTLFSPGEFPNWGTFDVIYIANVFHHIPHELHHDILVHLRTQLKPNGHLFMFEHNPWNPVTVRTINQCEFDKDAVLLPPDYAMRAYKKAGFINVNRNFTLFFPAFLNGLIPMEKYLTWLPLGAQYYIHAQ